MITQFINNMARIQPAPSLAPFLSPHSAAPTSSQLKTKRTRRLTHHPYTELRHYSKKSPTNTVPGRQFRMGGRKKDEIFCVLDT